MEITKITINGVEYEIEDSKAQALLSLLSDSLVEAKDNQKELTTRMDNLENYLQWNML